LGLLAGGLNFPYFLSIDLAGLLGRFASNGRTLQTLSKDRPTGRRANAALFERASIEERTAP
jgi:hypothetical protein